MTMKTDLRLVLMTICVALVALALAGSSAPRPVLAESVDADGAKLFVDSYKCNGCHSVVNANVESRAKSEKLKGPDLSGYKTSLDFGVFAAYMRGEEKIEDKTHRLKFKGTDEELQAILDWLGSLEAQ